MDNNCLTSGHPAVLWQRAAHVTDCSRVARNKKIGISNGLILYVLFMIYIHTHTHTRARFTNVATCRIIQTDWPRVGDPWFNSLKPSGYCIYQILISAHRLNLFPLRGSQNNERLLLYMAFTYRFL